MNEDTHENFVSSRKSSGNMSDIRHTATKTMLKSEENARSFVGRTVVQLGTGTPKEACAAFEWMTAHDVHYPGGAVRYPGLNMAAASALDLALLTIRYGRFMAIIHAANVCKSEGVSIDDFISLFPDEPITQGYAKVIHEEGFHECTATLQVRGAALQRIQRQGVDANMRPCRGAVPT